MFEKPNVNAKFTGMQPRLMEKDDAEVTLVEITCEINPFTKELAGDLDEFVKSVLFTRQDAEVNSKMAGVTFRLPLRPQSVVVKMAPDQSKDGFTIDEAKIGDLHARRGKSSAAWKLVFTMTCSPISEHQLAQIVDCYCKSRYLTFADASPDLFAEVSKEEKRAKRGAAADAGGSATAH